MSRVGRFSWLSRYRRPILGATGAALILAGTIGAAVFAAGNAAGGAPVAGGPAPVSLAADATQDPLDSFELDRVKPGQAAKVLCETYRSALAARLGVTADRLDAAMRDASKAAVDRAAADGLIPAERAAKLKEKIDAAQEPVCKALPLPVPVAGAGPEDPQPRAGARKGVLDVKALLDVAAKTLGVPRDTLLSGLRALGPDEDLRTLAKKHAVAYEVLAGALRKAAQGQVDAAVAAGRISEALSEQTMAAFSRGLERGRFLPKGFPGPPEGV